MRTPPLNVCRSPSSPTPLDSVGSLGRKYTLSDWVFELARWFGSFVYVYTFCSHVLEKISSMALCFSHIAFQV